jgi:D-3-phosphoglycerate dehydrogenase / 2-oxoglutarate reductase
MPTALLTDAERFPFDPDDKAALDAAGVELRELAGHDPGDVLTASRGVEAVFVYHARFPRETIERLDGVRVLARCGAGYDNIDVAAARERGIEVVYVPDYGADDVADHALALLLACARRIAESDRAIRRGAWISYAELSPMWRLRGRTLGVIGYGRIGRNLAEKGRALGLRVLVHDPVATDESTERDRLLRESDFVSLHLPLSDATHHSIGQAELALMKPTAILVNTARGAIVDEAALVAALRAGAIGGAGLDVFEETPLPPGHPLRSLENVVLTPHSAAYTEEGLAEVRKRPLADALRILRGEAPKDAVP